MTTLNRNSYITLGICESLRDWLFNIANTISSEQVDECQISFTPMMWNNLHVTFLFCSEYLHSIPAEQLKAWHTIIADAVSRFVVTVNSGPLMASVNIDRLGVFPPGKKNLVVAFLRVAPAIYSLQEQVVQLTVDMKKSNAAFGMIADLNRDWQPHCTLGKLQAPKNRVEYIGMMAINRMEKHIHDYEEHSLATTGLKMSGFTPKQKWIDWDVTLSFTDNNSNSSCRHPHVDLRYRCTTNDQHQDKTK
mmetsp:Transcript_25728/g.43168  ORF Transcript_25728/g.43168 Transcript_25728/m.43168 type:complete len:248 (+) Transcript_25728:23-766(+)